MQLAIFVVVVKKNFRSHLIHLPSTHRGLFFNKPIHGSGLVTFS